MIIMPKKPDPSPGADAKDSVHFLLSDLRRSAVWALAAAFVIQGLITYVPPYQNFDVSGNLTVGQWIYGNMSHVWIYDAPWTVNGTLYNDSLSWFNASTQESEINVLWINASSQEARINALNTSRYDQNITDLWSNASGQEARISSNSNPWVLTGNNVLYNTTFNQMIIQSANTSLIYGQSIQIGLLPINGVPTNITPNGVILGYHFDEAGGTSVLDYSGNGYTAIEQGNDAYGILYGKSGIYGTGLIFNSTGDTIGKNLTRSLSGIINNVSTVSLWVKPSIPKKATNVYVFYNLGTPGTGNSRWTLGYNGGLNGNVYAEETNSSTSFCSPLATENYNLSTNTWYHIAVVYNNTGAWIYVNGTYATYTPCKNANIDLTAKKLVIGEYGSSSYYYNGSMDEFTIFNRNLNASEILSLYNSGVQYQAVTSFPYLAPTNNKILDLGLYNQSFRYGYFYSTILTPGDTLSLDKKYPSYLDAIKDIPLSEKNGKTMTDIHNIPIMFRDDKGHDDTLDLYAYVNALRNTIIEQDKRITELEAKIK